MGIVGHLVDKLPRVHEALCYILSITQYVVEAFNPIPTEDKGGIKSNSSSLDIEEFKVNQLKNQWDHRIRITPESPCHNCVTCDHLPESLVLYNEKVHCGARGPILQVPRVQTGISWGILEWRSSAEPLSHVIWKPALQPVCIPCYGLNLVVCDCTFSPSLLHTVKKPGFLAQVEFSQRGNVSLIVQLVVEEHIV